MCVNYSDEEVLSLIKRYEEIGFIQGEEYELHVEDCKFRFLDINTREVDSIEYQPFDDTYDSSVDVENISDMRLCIEIAEKRLLILECV